MIETGEFTTIAELADHEGLGRSYVTRILRMTLLAPDIVEMILAGEQGTEVSLASLKEPFPELWAEQTSIQTQQMNSSAVPGHSMSSR